MEISLHASSVLGCPDRGVLINFDLGKLPAQDLDAVAQHVASCSPCERFLHALHGQTNEDSVVGRLKQSLGMAPFPDGAIDAPTLSSSETVKIDALTSTLGAWPAASDRRALEAINKYELLGKLGQGGMGVIYRARQVALNRRVALKMILAGHHASAHTVARFLREGKAVARLRHPNIVQVYEFGESEGLPYYTMELVEGGNLKERLAEGPFEPREAAELVRTLAAAAEYAHRKGILHRDLKPANILLAEDGTPKITDFGLAKWLDAESSEPTSAALTEAEAILGTPSYMAPEQAECRSADIGRATDVYALGVILYESMTGKPPLVGMTKVETLALVRSSEPVPPSRHRPGIPPWLEAICLKCLEKSPGRRYPTAQALADDLGRWLRDERPRGIPTRLERFGRGARRHVAAVLSGTAMLSAGTVLYLNYHPTQPAYDPMQRVSDPSLLAAERIEADLARGRAVTLIGMTGEPRWSRWRAGGARSHAGLGEDLTFAVTSWKLGLLELVRNPRSPRYRFAAQVRHDHSDVLKGEIGIYFARSPSWGNPAEIQVFTQLAFNAIRGRAERMARLRDGIRPSRLPKDDVVQITSHIHVDAPSPNDVDRRLGGVAGPDLLQLGEGNGRWHDLEVTVTPELVSARWDGQPFEISTARIQEIIDVHLTRFPPRAESPLARGFSAEFNPRGGLGLYIWRGSASFRAVTITPF